MGVTSAWSPLGNFLEGQAHPNVFCLLPFIEPGFSIFFDVKFFVFGSLSLTGVYPTYTSLEMTQLQTW